MRVTEYMTDNLAYQMRLVNYKEDLWAIYTDGLRLLRDKPNGKDRFEHCPIPSSRTDEWIKNHSFTFIEAQSRLEDIEQRIRAELTKKR